MDAQDGVSYSQSDNEAYANNFGSNFASYTNLALDINGYDSGMAATNNHVGNNSVGVLANTKEYNSLDKEQGDNWIVPVARVVIAAGTYLAKKTAAEAAKKTAAEAAKKTAAKAREPEYVFGKDPLKGTKSGTLDNKLSDTLFYNQLKRTEDVIKNAQTPVAKSKLQKLTHVLGNAAKLIDKLD